MRVNAKRMVLTGMILLAAIAAVAFWNLRPTGTGRLPCGHQDETFRSISAFRDWVKGKPHLCTGGRVVTDLAMFRDAHGIFQKEFNRSVTNLDELTPYAEWLQRRSYGFRYLGDEQAWSLAVDRTSRLPGFYLLTMDGNVYFDELRPPTTNDLCLSHR